ncbi:MAG: hypothetical protein AAF961_08330, partial [Planctomycetota bacterium]
MILVQCLAAALMTAVPSSEAEVKEAAKEIVGVWTLEYNDPSYERKTDVVLVGRQFGDLYAWRMGKKGLEPFSKVRLEGEELHLTIKPVEYDGEVTADLTAWLDQSDACRGTIAYAAADGDQGEIPFVGKRVKEQAFEEASKWALQFDTDDGVRRRPVVTVVEYQEKPYAWYSSEDYELPATKMTIDGDKVVMSLSV